MTEPRPAVHSSGVNAGVTAAAGVPATAATGMAASTVGSCERSASEGAADQRRQDQCPDCEFAILNSHLRSSDRTKPAAVPASVCRSTDPTSLLGKTLTSANRWRKSPGQLLCSLGLDPPHHNWFRSLPWSELRSRLKSSEFVIKTARANSRCSRSAFPPIIRPSPIAHRPSPMPGDRADFASAHSCVLVSTFSSIA